MENVNASERVNSDEVVSWIDESATWYLSDEDMEYLNLSLTISFHGLLSVTGVVSNLINMVIFCRLGLNNSMSVGIFGLSFTDFNVTCYQMVSCCFYLVGFVYPDCPVDPWMMGGFLFSWAHYIGYLISCWITTLLSVERCYSVVSPFTVRRAFTRKRCVFATIIIYLVHIGTHCPFFAYTQLEWTLVNPQNNRTAILKFRFSEDSAKWELLSDIISGIVLSLLSQAILIVCTVWMIASLRSSSTIRRYSSQVKQSHDGKEETLSPKERRMCKTVLSLAIIVSVCNVPRFVTTAAHHIVPGMNHGAYRNLQIIMWEIKLGVNTSMSVGVFALSFTDILVTALQLAMYICYVHGKMNPASELDFTALGSFGIGWMRYVCYFISGWITTGITVEKCVCVVWPFRVKRLFTKARSLVAVVAIYAVHFAFIVPIYAVQRLRWTTAYVKAADNETVGERRVFTFVYSEDFVDLETALNNTYALALAVTSQVILLVCTVWMIVALKSSSQIRRTRNDDAIGLAKSKYLDSRSTYLSTRERKLVKVAMGLGVVLTASNIPRYAVVSAYYGIPGMNKGEYKNLSDFLWDVTDFFSIINCSSNFMVYWLLNSNFRQTFRENFTIRFLKISTKW
ncbi:hypothetical protein Btru_020926 [Bulinus truncatus]|nr:hypothetical protein Btru_020926 [Bulinus truncatus]